MKKRASNVERDEDLAVVVRYWGVLPRRVRAAVMDVVRAFATIETDVCFRTPKGAAWKDVEIVLLAPERDRVRISVKGRTGTFTYAQIGLADRRRPTVPRAEWRMLRTYAENPEPDAYDRLPRRPTLKMEISRFRAWLKEFFGIAGDPLLPFKPMRWLPRFRIRVEEK